MLDAKEYELFERVLGDYVRRNEETIYGIEIGVLNGETSKFLLGLSDRIHLFGIDPLTPDPVEPSLQGSIAEIKANTNEFGPRWCFIKWWSQYVAEQFHDKSIDFVFVDGSHLYRDVLTDFQKYHPKLRLGGLMFFHDSRALRGGPDFWEGPSKFVDELIERNDSVKLVDEEFSTTVFERVY